MELTKQETAGLLHLCLDMGELLLCSGAEVHRVEDTLGRMGTAYGAVKTDIFVITSSIVITMAFPGGVEQTQTRRVCNPVSTNFARLEILNDLSRRCCISPLPMDALQEELRRIERQTAPRWVVLFFSSILASGSFAVFFGGTLWDGLAAALFAVLICGLQKYLAPLCPNNLVFNLLTSFSAGLCICLWARVIPGLHMDKIMIGDIMLLIPGMAVTNAVRDILVGDTISGIMRLIESLLWAVALACGCMAAIWLVGG